jgi:hypothetical protein
VKKAALSEEASCERGRRNRHALIGLGYRRVSEGGRPHAGPAGLAAGQGRGMVDLPPRSSRSESAHSAGGVMDTSEVYLLVNGEDEIVAYSVKAITPKNVTYYEAAFGCRLMCLQAQLGAGQSPATNEITKKFFVVSEDPFFLSPGLGIKVVGAQRRKGKKQLNGEAG